MFISMKNETITVSPTKNPYVTMPYSRERYYKEQYGVDASVKDRYAVHVVSVLLIDTSGDIIVQKRSLDKGHNAGLIDKTIGGHISYDNSADYTVMVETVQELSTPSITVDSDADFMKALDLLHPYLETIAIIKKVQIQPWHLTRLVAGDKKSVTNIVNLYFGVYGGRMRPADKEASGMLCYSLNQLIAEIKSSPNMFTEDLAELIGEYKNEIIEFQKLVKKTVADQAASKAAS
jgi:isopentenyldiphosphate isomerase